MLKHDILTEINMRRKKAYRTPLESFDIVERWFNDALNEMGDAKMWIKRELPPLRKGWLLT